MKQLRLAVYVSIFSEACWQLRRCSLSPRAWASPSGSDKGGKRSDGLDADVLAKELRLSIEAALQPGTYSPQTSQAANLVEKRAEHLEKLARPITWRDGDLELLDGTWDLIYTSNSDVDRGNFMQRFGVIR